MNDEQAVAELHRTLRDGFQKFASETGIRVVSIDVTWSSHPMTFNGRPFVEDLTVVTKTTRFPT